MFCSSVFLQELRTWSNMLHLFCIIRVLGSFCTGLWPKSEYVYSSSLNPHCNDERLAQGSVWRAQWQGLTVVVKKLKVLPFLKEGG